MKAPQNISRRISTLLFGLLLSGCATTGHDSLGHRSSDSDFKIYKMPDLSHMPGTLEEQPPFTCTFEKGSAPPRASDADKLVQYAYWLMSRHPKEHSWSSRPKDEEVAREIERLFRIASAWGHDQATSGLWRILGSSDDRDEIIKVLATQGTPHSYFLMGISIDNHRRYDEYLHKKPEDGRQKAALQYIRKAADLGNPGAQFSLGQMLSGLTTDDPVPRRTGKEMTRCAADHGFKVATLYTARDLHSDKQYAEALRYFQLAYKAGIVDAMEMLRDGFSNPEPDDPHYMGLPKDEERAARYDRIAGIFRNAYESNDHFFTEGDVDLIAAELDRIVPLPPAKLPEWDGKIERLEKLRNAEAPPLPSEEIIKEMATRKGLDPETGREPPVQLKAPPAFTCTYEKDRIPPRDPDADKLFQRAEWLLMKNRSERDPEIYEEVERLYRIAAAWKHDKAAENLANLILDVHTAYSDFITKPVEIAEELVRRGIPRGYGLMSRILEKGHGVKKDPKARGQYLWRAANLGDPWAQNYMGKRLEYDELEKYGFLNLASSETVADEMRRCAADQGDRDAAYTVASNLHEEGKHDEAIKYFQIALKAGEIQATKMLEEAFSRSANVESTEAEKSQADFWDSVSGEYSRIAAEKGEAEATKWLNETMSNFASNDEQDHNLDENRERAARYDQIFQVLSNSFQPFSGYGYSSIEFTIDELDQIVPLPPAKLPEWNGKIKWVENWKRSEAPPLPSEKRIEEMALKKGLDPKTGYPLKKDSK